MVTSRSVFAPAALLAALMLGGCAGGSIPGEPQHAGLDSGTVSQHAAALGNYNGLPGTVGASSAASTSTSNNAAAIAAALGSHSVAPGGNYAGVTGMAAHASAPAGSGGHGGGSGSGSGGHG